jgi:hypothetical protein
VGLKQAHGVTLIPVESVIEVRSIGGIVGGGKGGNGVRIFGQTERIVQTFEFINRDTLKARSSVPLFQIRSKTVVGLFPSDAQFLSGSLLLRPF